MPDTGMKSARFMVSVSYIDILELTILKYRCWQKMNLMLACLMSVLFSFRFLRSMKRSPIYSLKKSTAVSDLDWLNRNLSFPKANIYRNQFVNSEKSNLPKLLVIHDSYLNGNEKYFSENISEVTFIHRDNLLGSRELEDYHEVLNPNIVVLENLERSFGFEFDIP